MRGFRLYPKNLFTLVALYRILSIERVRPTEKNYRVVAATKKLYPSYDRASFTGYKRP